MTYGDLPDNPPSTVFLQCPACSAQYSAHKGDYFMESPTREIKCCKRVCILVRQIVILERIS